MALADCNWASARRKLACTLVSSNRANTWPALAFMPSSTSTSTTLPVILDETVASRRAVTYPEAFSTVCSPAPPPLCRAAAVLTSAVRCRVSHQAAPASISRSKAIASPTSGGNLAWAWLCVRSASRPTMVSAAPSVVTRNTLFRLRSTALWSREAVVMPRCPQEPFPPPFPWRELEFVPAFYFSAVRLRSGKN